MKTTIRVPFVILFPFLLFAQKSSFSEASFDVYVQSVMKAFDVPGVSIAIVKDGKTLLAKGYGIRKLGESSPVDSRTLFGIASNTKAVTATALALLVEEGKIKWDDPVINHLPWFRMSDPYVTRELTIRDLMVHRSGLGLGAGDLLWWPPTTYNRKEITERLRYLPLVTSFRSAYAYDNVLYTVAGEVIHAVSGKTWEEFVQERILVPVGMTTSKMRQREFDPTGNTAITHAKVDGRLQVVKPFASDNTNPAGGINSNAEDMAKWMIVQLDSGRIAPDKRLFSRGTAIELWSLVTPIPIRPPSGDLAPLRANFNGYGLGFGVRDYRGYKTVSHTGGLPGYVSRLTLIPELKLGVTVLTNQESGGAFNAITYYVLDRFLNAPKHDWLSAFKRGEIRADSMAMAAEQRAAGSRDSISKPSLALAGYSGTYRDAWYGDITIGQEDGKMILRFTRTPVLVGTMEHYQHDTFIVRWHDRELRADAYITFALHPEGTIDQAKMKAVSPATDFSFDFHDLLLKPVSHSDK
ncbi:MAG: serine hydrolase [Ignavibacteria bacterium]|nr:serine hydrolase [Ignavibacteria bacterium]